MKKDELTWTLLKRESLTEDAWIDFARSTYRFPDGRCVGPFYTYGRLSFVVIAALDEEGNYLCVRQYRQGIGCVTTEFPAGGIEHSRHRRPSDQEALEAARRELAEETGFTSQQWTPLLTLPANPTLSDDTAFLFLAENCRKTQAQHLDPTEFLGVVHCRPEQLESLLPKEEFPQPLHAVAYLLAQRRRASETSK
jgi:ADP-ribose pyrophosphatase